MSKPNFAASLEATTRDALAKRKAAAEANDQKAVQEIKMKCTDAARDGKFRAIITTLLGNRTEDRLLSNRVVELLEAEGLRVTYEKIRLLLDSRANTYPVCRWGPLEEGEGDGSVSTAGGP